MKSFGSSDGLTYLLENTATPAKSAVAYNTTDYHTGVLVGDIKGAFLTGQGDDTDLVGATPLDDDPSGYIDTAAAEADGWTFGNGWSITGRR